jgi:hypothetical protein
MSLDENDEVKRKPAGFRLPSPVHYHSDIMGSLAFQSHESVGLLDEALGLFDRGGTSRFLAEQFLSLALQSPDDADWSQLSDAEMSELLGWLGANSDLEIPTQGPLELQISTLERGMRTRREDFWNNMQETIDRMYEDQIARFRSSILAPSFDADLFSAAAMIPDQLRESVSQLNHLFAPAFDDRTLGLTFDTSLLSQAASLDRFLGTFPDPQELKEDALREVGLDVDVLRWEGLESYIEQFDAVVMEHAPALGSSHFILMLAQWPQLPKLVTNLASQLPEAFRDHRITGLKESLAAFQQGHFHAATVTLSAQLDGLMGDLVVLSQVASNSAVYRLDGIRERLNHIRNEFRNGKIQSSVLVAKGPFFRARNDIAHGDPNAPLSEEMAVRLLLHIVTVLAVTVKRYGTFTGDYA